MPGSLPITASTTPHCQLLACWYLKTLTVRDAVAVSADILAVLVLTGLETMAIRKPDECLTSSQKVQVPKHGGTRFQMLCPFWGPNTMMFGQLDPHGMSLLVALAQVW